MRITIVSPAREDAPSGNARTVARFARHLARRGHDARVVLGEDADARDLTLLYHARRCGHLADAARRLGGLVVALGGTDLDHDLRDPARRDLVLRAL